MNYILKFYLSKGDGEFPTRKDVIEKYPNANYEELIKSSMHFDFNNSNGSLNVIDWKLLDDGLSSLALNDDGPDSVPQPIVWLKLANEVDHKNKGLWVEALTSDYILQIEGINEPYYFQDHNGYSKVEPAKLYADEVWDYLEEILKEIQTDECKQYTPELLLTRKKSIIDNRILLSLEVNLSGYIFNYSYIFSNQEAIEVFNFSDTEYSDLDGNICSEENPLTYKLHDLLRSQVEKKQKKAAEVTAKISKNEKGLTLSKAKDIIAKVRAYSKSNSIIINVYTYKSITYDAAKELAKVHGWLGLWDIESISDEVAEELSKHKDQIYLDRLNSLSANAAQALGRYQGCLELNGLEYISDEAAEGLSIHIGELSLNGLKSITDKAAQVLSKHQGNLRIGGLEKLSDNAANSLGNHKGYLSLRGLRNLSDKAAAGLSKHEGTLNLVSIHSLSDNAAGSISKNQGDLYLYSLASISDNAAEFFSQHVGSLELDGLVDLSAKSAEALSKHKGVISLNKLTSITDEAAAALGKFEGTLSLQGLTSLSNKAAAGLSNHKGNLKLSSLKSLTISASEELGKHHGFLDLGDSKISNDAAIENLAKHHGGLSWSARKKTLSKNVTAKLSTLQGDLSLMWIESLSDEAAVEFIDFKYKLRVDNSITNQINRLREKRDGA